MILGKSMRSINVDPDRDLDTSVTPTRCRQRRRHNSLYHEPRVNDQQATQAHGRFLFAAAVVFLTFVGQEYTDDGWILWYQTRIFDIPIQYLVFGGLVFLLWPVLLQRPPINLTNRLRLLGLWPWVVMAWITLIVALAVGLLRQANAPFKDWRNWVVLAVTAIVAAKLLSDRHWKRFVLTDLAIGYGALSVVHLGLWLGGGGTEFFDVRVPLADFYDLSLAIFAVIVAAEAWIRGFPDMSRGYVLALRLTVIASSILVMLSFKRSLWAVLIISTIGIGVWAVRVGGSSRRAAFKLAATVGLVAVISVISFGPDTVGARLASFNPFADGAYTETNEDHVNDVRDALSVIAREPLLGVGIGTTYETELIAEWKSESFEVHNAFVNSWLKFGLLGLVTYVGFHVALGVAFLRSGSSRVVGFTAAGITLFAEQVMSMVQTWPYGGIGFTMARGVMLGVLLVCLTGGQEPSPGAQAGSPRRLSTQ